MHSVPPVLMILVRPQSQEPLPKQPPAKRTACIGGMFECCWAWVAFLCFGGCHAPG